MHLEACQYTALIAFDSSHFCHGGQNPFCSPVPGKEKCYLSPDALDYSRTSLFPIAVH